jgi:hypothetical protein
MRRGWAGIGTSRQAAKSSVELLGGDRDSHIQFVIAAMKPYAKESGIGERSS